MMGRALLAVFALGAAVVLLAGDGLALPEHEAGQAGAHPGSGGIVLVDEQAGLRPSGAAVPHIGDPDESIDLSGTLRPIETAPVPNAAQMTVTSARSTISVQVRTTNARDDDARRKPAAQQVDDSDDREQPAGRAEDDDKRKKRTEKERDKREKRRGRD